MKCTQCGNDFEGNYCPECGGRAETFVPVMPPMGQQPQSYQPLPVQPGGKKNRKPKKKKPFFLRWWFILPAIIAVLACAGKVRNGRNKMELGTIRWPSSTAGNLLPTPKSTTGKFSCEHDDGFFVYVGDTSKEDYDAYVDSCKDNGFIEDYSRGDTYYYAENADGWYLSLNYKGDSVMTVSISAPYEKAAETEETGETEPAEAEVVETETETAEATETSVSTNDTGIDPDFKAAMDAYESFYEEYCDLLKKYSENPTDLTLIGKYADMMVKAEGMDEAFEEWDEDDLNAEELKYYLDVNNRVMQMLIDVSDW